MGKEVTKQNDGIGTEIEPITKKGRKRTGSDDTRTDKKNGVGTGTGTAGTGNTEADSTGESQQLSELAEITSPVPIPEKPTTKKSTRKKKRTVKKQQPVFSSEQITTLIMAVSGIASAKQGLEVFALSEVEARQIAEPLSQIIVDSGYSETFGKYGNYIALGTACLMIFVPRFIMFSQMQKAKKVEKRGGLKIEPNNKKSEGKGSNRTDNNGSNDRSNSTTETNGSSVLASIPSIA